MSIQHRDEFLARLSKQLGRPRPATPSVLELPFDTHHQVLANATADELLQQFREYSETALGARVEVGHCDELNTLLLKVCRHYLGGTDREVVVGSDERLLSRLDSLKLVEQGLKLYHWDNKLGYDANIQHAEAARIGVVWAEQALTESGTLVLYSEPEQGRAISLLPEVSVFIVAKSSLAPRATQAMEALHTKADAGERMPSCVNLISGPSSTADIELIKVVGVHGPLEVCYIVLDDL